jgi:SAM-dependent methyltransferase
MQLCLHCHHEFAACDWQCPRCHYQPASVDFMRAFAPELAHGHDGFRADNVDELARLELSHFWFGARNQLISWALRKYFPGIKSFLEIGCGTGCVLTHLRTDFPDLTLSGSEALLQSLAWSQRRLPDVTLFQMDARQIPFVQEFDVIGAFDVIEHVQEDEIVLQQMHQAVKPGGGIIITVPQHRFLWSPEDDYGQHKRRYERKELIDKIRRTGFSIVRVTSFVTFLLPLVCLSRLLSRKDRYDPSRELRIGAFTNAVLATVLSLERAVLKAGMSFPTGSSLLAVARRPVSPPSGAV